MSTVFLASYKGTHKGVLGLFNRGVRLVNRGIYSHNEIVISEDPFTKPSFCVSSTGMGKGVHGKTMQLTKEDWDVIEIPWVTPEDVSTWLNKHLNEKYDWLGVARFLLPWAFKQHPTNWFCTEVCGDIMKFTDSWRYGPCDLPEIVKSYLGLTGM